MTRISTKKSSLPSLISSALLLLFLIVSLWLIFQYADKERQRDLINWQSRLALLAEIRAESIESWLEQQKNQLGELAANPSLRLYLSQYASEQQIDRSVLSAQQGHVRNLLRSTVGLFDLHDQNMLKPLNIQQQTEYGLAVLGADQQLLMSTSHFSFDLQKHKNQLDIMYQTAKPQIIDFFRTRNGAAFGFVFPVFKIQDLASTAPVGAVLVVLNPEEKLYEFLANKQSATKTDETLMVKTQGPAIIYISPVNNQTRLFHQLPDNNNLLAASYAFHNPGDFVTMADYNGDMVLVTGRKLQNTPWGIIQKISASEALSESNTHQQFLLTTFTVFVLFVTAAFIAVWRHSTSVRLKSLSESLETQTRLLNAVTDNIRDHIVLVDEEEKIVFINPAFAMLYALNSEELKNKHLASIIGVETADELKNNLCGANNTCVLPLRINHQQYIFHVSSSPLLTGAHKGEKLYVLHDITRLNQEQEKREQLGRGIINTLVKAVDLHDPYCANHSARTREVALDIAQEIQLSEKQIESLEIASLLANIGKLLVPKEVLTKMDALSDKESAQLRRHIDYALDILSDLSFDGPVMDIISQKNERMDGSGYPKGLSGDEILLESRILAVANAFVAMASSRAYREGRSVKEVVNLLLEQSESLYDRQVVAALFHIAENRANWASWQQVK